MPTKSNNTIGNPYHDDAGKFTSKDGSSNGKSENVETNQVQTQQPQAQLKSGVDLSNIGQALQQTQSQTRTVDIATDLTMPTSIQDAEMQGNRILGSNGAVGYAANRTTP